MERTHDRGGDTWDGTAWARREFSDVALGDARRSERLVAVVAVRLLNLKLLAVAEPDQPVSAETLGPEALSILEAKFGPPPDGWTCRTVLVCIARLGGFLARRRDGTPGRLTIWRGWQKLMPMIQGYHLAQGGA